MDRWPFNRDRIVTGAAGPFNSQMREGRLSRRELVTGCTDRRYEQLEKSPEAIVQELRPAVCEHRQT